MGIDPWTNARGPDSVQQYITKITQAALDSPEAGLVWELFGACQTNSYVDDKQIKDTSISKAAFSNDRYIISARGSRGGDVEGPWGMWLRSER